jgi:hypothetical protein
LRRKKRVHHGDTEKKEQKLNRKAHNRGEAWVRETTPVPSLMEEGNSTDNAARQRGMYAI